MKTTIERSAPLRSDTASYQDVASTYAYFEAQFMEQFEQPELTEDQLLELEILDQSMEPQTDWPEPNPDGTVSDADFITRCQWRLGNIGHALDAVREQISSDADAEEWLELKKAILAAKSIGDIYAIIDITIELEAVGYDFARRVGVDAALYDATSNK